MGVSHHLLHAHGLVLGQHVVGRHHATERQVAGPQDMHAAVRRQVEGGNQVCRAFDQSGDRLVGALDAYFERNARVADGEFVDQARQIAVGVAVHRHQPDVALIDALHLLEFGGDAPFLGFPAPGQRHDRIAGRGQPHPLGKALEQSDAEVALQLEDLPVDGGSGDVELFGGALDRAGAGDLIDIAQRRRNEGILHSGPY